MCVNEVELNYTSLGISLWADSEMAAYSLAGSGLSVPVPGGVYLKYLVIGTNVTLFEMEFWVQNVDMVFATPLDENGNLDVALV